MKSAKQCLLVCLQGGEVGDRMRSINWAQTPPGSVETSIAAGFQRHMTKPVEEELVSAIASLNASNARLTKETQ